MTISTSRRTQGGPALECGGALVDRELAGWQAAQPTVLGAADPVLHSRARCRTSSAHIMAVVQLHNDTEGRRYYRRKLAAGKTSMELRALETPRVGQDDRWRL